MWEGELETGLGDGGKEKDREGGKEGGMGGHVHWTYTREQSHPGVQGSLKQVSQLSFA